MTVLRLIMITNKNVGENLILNKFMDYLTDS